MSRPEDKSLRVPEGDLDFLVDTVSPEVRDKSALKRILREDDDFRKQFVTDERVFRRLMDDEELFMRVSPALFFEILLRRAANDLKETRCTFEKTSSMTIPVFDTKEVVELLNNDALLVYLADMLASFTKIQSYSFSFRVRKGVWKKIRFSDFDIHTLMHFSEAVEEAYRLGFYKRIADICLFILGIFPDYAEREYRYPFSRQLRPRTGWFARMSPEDYEKEGRKFYRLACEHPVAREMDLAEVFRLLHQEFEKARKPLNFIAEHYLEYKREAFFS